MRNYLITEPEVLALRRLTSGDMEGTRILDGLPLAQGDWESGIMLLDPNILFWEDTDGE